MLDQESVVIKYIYSRSYFSIQVLVRYQGQAATSTSAHQGCRKSEDVVQIGGFRCWIWMDLALACHVGCTHVRSVWVNPEDWPPTNHYPGPGISQQVAWQPGRAHVD